MAPTDKLFPQDQKGLEQLVKDLRQLVRSVNPKYDLRALRRGSLQALAAANVDLEVIRVFSGHTNIPMLLRYLGRGLAVRQRKEQGSKAARAALRI